MCRRLTEDWVVVSGPRYDTPGEFGAKPVLVLGGGACPIEKRGACSWIGGGTGGVEPAGRDLGGGDDTGEQSGAAPGDTCGEAPPPMLWRAGG